MDIAIAMPGLAPRNRAEFNLPVGGNHQVYSKDPPETVDRMAVPIVLAYNGEDHYSPTSVCSDGEM